jgi:hypothetical protein
MDEILSPLMQTLTDTVNVNLPTALATGGASPTTTNTSPLNQFLETGKAIFELANLVWGFGGLVIGAIGGWLINKRTRPYNFRAVVTNHPKRILNYAGGKTLLIAECKVVNKGDVRLVLPYSRLKVKQILPVHTRILDAQEKGHPLIEHGQREMWLNTVYNEEFKEPDDLVRIESKEEQDIQHHVLLAPEIEVVEIYMFFRNTEDEDGFVWDATTYYNIKTGKVIGAEEQEPKGGQTVATQDVPVED